MPLSPREAFKVGALARMVEEGLTPEAMLARVKAACEKRADGWGTAGKLLGSAASAGGELLASAGKLGGGVLLAAPPIIGALGGYGLARGTDISDTDIEEIKDRELAEEYVRQTERLKHQRAIRARQHAQSRSRFYP